MRTYFIYYRQTWIPRSDELWDVTEILDQKLFYTSNP